MTEAGSDGETQVTAGRVTGYTMWHKLVAMGVMLVVSVDKAQLA